MDIRPWAHHHEDMETRRDVILRAAKVAGIAIAAPAIRAAAPMVRLPSERGGLTDELYRFRAELEDITHQLERRTPSDTLARVTALWANLEAFNVPHSEIAGIKGRTAVLAGVNAINRSDRTAGPRWFNSAIRQAQVAGDEGLVSYVHARRAVSHLYLSDRRTGDAMVDAARALMYAQSDEQRGMAHMMSARALAEKGQRRHAVIEVESAMDCAYSTGGEQYPRPDRWTRAQAHLMAGTALARFGSLLPAVEDHARMALLEAPEDAAHYRAHVWLNLAEARTRGREYDGAAQAALGVMTNNLRPVHVDRVKGIVVQAELQDQRNVAMQRVRDRLKELTFA